MEKSNYGTVRSSTLPVRCGVIGAGRWAREAHIPAFAAHPAVDLVAVADTDPAALAAVYAEYPAIATFATAAEMLAAGPLEAVAIATPDDAHAADATLALAAGCHVLCEKPLAPNLEAARELATLAARSDRRTMVGFTLRYAPAIRGLRTLVQQGVIGRPQHLQIFQQNGQFLDPAHPFHWKMDRDRAGGGAIVEYGIHTLDLARWLTGEIAAVAATGRTWITARPAADGGQRPVSVDDSTAWLMRFASGETGLAHAGWATTGRPPGLELRLYGSEGAVRCLLSDDLPGSQALWRAGALAQRFESVPLPVQNDEPWHRRFHAALVDAFIGGIVDGDPPEATFADGAHAQAALTAVLTALEPGAGWVDVPGI